MNRWAFLAGAIACEVTGSLSLKAALDHPGWYVLVVLGYVSAFVLLGFTLRAGMPLGVAYGIWGAVGVALTAAAAAVLFAEPLTLVMVIGIVLVGVGVLCVEIGSQIAHRSAVSTVSAEPGATH
ncbi:QacE family quaternary ammonium compound efflux SMR transporter [Rhodococcus triatomae]|uniref:Small multidrug resistance pump n=1 Tax=Rhodococcus triatomae TaxID=300028 RepID=A0A1G8FM59_9NOCA|nr:SMR family transporter [Rhodococcus triatomae]QNG19522.1 QacE family quaternary ammonium compound efflux SMR transporter [Rhodococcus triatomae]QNG24563.1 QacE family quaternary ammonium compound efflux SMR transporter [Rhodococcus triatomae]SDH83235.1 small multidrug resistance pump [Rhodococcus triatomae]